MNYDVVKVLEHYNIDYEHIPHEDEVYFLCPFHNDTSFGSARFNTEEGIWRCFSCPDGGNIFQFVSKLEGCTLWEAEKLIGSDFDLLGSYSTDRLKKKLGNFYEQQVKRSKAKGVTKGCIANMIKAIGSQKFDLEFFSKWYPIIIYYFGYDGVEDREYTREILDTYSIFFTELKSKES